MNLLKFYCPLMTISMKVYAMNKVALSSASEPLEFTLHQEIETITILQVGPIISSLQ